MDALIFWFSLIFVGLGGGGVVLSRRPAVAVRGLTLLLGGLAGLFVSLHAYALTVGLLFLAVRGSAVLRRFLEQTPLPPEEGMVLRPFGFLCGLGDALFFTAMFWRGARGLTGVLPAEVSTPLDDSYLLPLEAAVWLCAAAAVGAHWLGRKGAP